MRDGLLRPRSEQQREAETHLRALALVGVDWLKPSLASSSRMRVKPRARRRLLKPSSSLVRVKPCARQAVSASAAGNRLAKPPREPCPSFVGCLLPRGPRWGRGAQGTAAALQTACIRLYQPFNTLHVEWRATSTRS